MMMLMMTRRQVGREPRVALICQKFACRTTPVSPSLDQTFRDTEEYRGRKRGRGKVEGEDKIDHRKGRKMRDLLYFSLKTPTHTHT
jgi:hypothetical protein